MGGGEIPVFFYIVTQVMCVLTLFSSSVLTSFKTLLVLGLAILTQLKKMEGLSSIVVGNQNSLCQKQEDNVYGLIFKSNALMFILVCK